MVSGIAENVAGTLSDTAASSSRPKHMKSEARSKFLLGASISTTRYLRVLLFQLMATQEPQTSCGTHKNILFHSHAFSVACMWHVTLVGAHILEEARAM